MICPRCNMNFGGFLSALDSDFGDVNLCTRCAQEAQEQRCELETRQEEIVRVTVDVILTTTDSIDGARVVSYLGIETVEVVIGTGTFSELSGDVSDFLGQRTRGFERKLELAKQVAFQRLKSKALEKGANAVIGVDLEYTEFSGSRLVLILNGTLVRVASIPQG